MCGLSDPAPRRIIRRGGILDRPDKKPKWPELRWPKALRNIWLQNFSFLLLALFSSVLLTKVPVTFIVLAAMLFGAIGLSMIFRRRAFCRYLCPVGGFIGLYSQAAPIELRIKEKGTCMTCLGKACYNGSESGYGCPWDVSPPALTKNSYSDCAWSVSAPARTTTSPSTCARLQQTLPSPLQNWMKPSRPLSCSAQR